MHTDDADTAAADTARTSTLRRYGATFDELERLVEDNPSLRSFMVGYLNEERVRTHLAELLGDVLDDAGKPDDHDRTVRADRLYVYRGHRVRIEVKGVQTATVRRRPDGLVVASFQCDASDARPVTLPNGSTVTTSCLVVGGFDVVAVPLFELTGAWTFGFAANHQLARTRSARFAAADRPHLLASMQTVTSDLAAPFTSDLPALLDTLIDEGRLAVR